MKLGNMLERLKGATVVTAWWLGGIGLGAILVENIPTAWSIPIGFGITLILMITTMQPVFDYSIEKIYFEDYQ
jgi:hypothetical protein